MHCEVCGGNEFSSRRVIWDALAVEWQLTNSERLYIDRQQGECCKNCGANLRSIALAKAIKSHFNFRDNLNDISNSSDLSKVRILELNEAGTLNPYLRKFPNYTFGEYPAVDMHSLPYRDKTFDIVVHSDTLEHIANPVHALSECRRVLKPEGSLCFTVPIIVGRMSRDRHGLPKSYHGIPTTVADDYVVKTEFGADIWAYIFEAGFTEVSIFAVDFPAATAFLAKVG
jgi:SAM-dependent methyltransferase